jgi:hypothetical protein
MARGSTHRGARRRTDRARGGYCVLAGGEVSGRWRWGGARVRWRRRRLGHRRDGTRLGICRRRGKRAWTSTSETLLFTLRWQSSVIYCCSVLLLLRGFADELLRVLYIVFGQLLESSSAEFMCSVLLRRGFWRSWKPKSYRTRPE